MGVARLGLVLLACCIARKSGLSSWPGVRAVELVSHNHLEPVKCVDLFAGSGLPWVTWEVAEGNCTLDAKTQCVTSPNYPEPYQLDGHCRISVGWLPLWTLRAVNFSVGAGDTLLVNGIAYYKDYVPPDGLLPTEDIIWRSDSSEQSTGWELCPRNDRVCLRLPAAARVWGAYEALLVLLGFAWAAASVALVSQLRSAPPAEDSAQQEARLLAADILQTLRQHPGGDSRALLGTLVGAAGPVQPQSRRQILQTFGLVLADIALDANMVLLMLRHGDVYFASCVLGASMFSMMREFRTSSPRALLADLAECLRSGVLSARLLNVLDQERGFEAMISLLLTSYALPFSSHSTVDLLSGLASLLSSVYGAAAYTHQLLDLEGLLREGDAAPSDSSSGSGEDEGSSEGEGGSEEEGEGGSSSSGEAGSSSSSSSAARCPC